MCSIAGVSFSPTSTIDRRKLTAALLSAGQVRGRDASGYAWVDGEEDGVYKKDLPGSQLSTSRLPQSAGAIIIHTRAATTGSPKDNRNNHPIESPSGNIRLVHNGIIWNHQDVRRVLTSGASLPEVDTAVLPAVIEELGLDGTDLLEGYAAAAWFDRETGGVIHLARFEDGPVAVAELEDGSIVFASTADILASALERMNLRWFGSYPEPFVELHDRDYFQLYEGEIITQGEVEWSEQFTYGESYSQAKRVTEGHGRAWWDGDDEDATPASYSSQPMALTSGGFSSASSPEQSFEDSDQFWVRDHSGSTQGFRSLLTLLEALRWHSNLTGGIDLVDEESGEMRWANHFEDIGEYSVYNGEEISWLTHPNEMQDYGSSIPAYVRDGVDVLRKIRA